MLNGPLAFAAQLDHIWWGVSVEDRKYGLPRIDALREAPAAVRFLSIEPLLEDLGEITWTASTGSSSAAKAARREADAGEWVTTIRSSAKPPMCRFSSSNGEACGNPKPGGCWMAAHSTKCRNVTPGKYCRISQAGMIEEVRNWEAEYVPVTDRVPQALLL